MAEKFLNTSQIGPVVQHMSGKTVPERVRADRWVKARLDKVFIHFAAYAARTETFAVLIGKQHLAVESRIAGHPAVAEFDIILNRLQRAGPDRAKPFFLAFAADMNHFA